MQFLISRNFFREIEKYNDFPSLVIYKFHEKMYCNFQFQGNIYLYCFILNTDWEIQAKAKASLDRKNTTSKKKKISTAGTDHRFVMKKRLFWNTREIPSDPIEVSLLYAQAVNSVVMLDELPVSEKVALQLAGLQAQVSLGEPSNRPELYQVRKNYKYEKRQFWANFFCTLFIYSFIFLNFKIFLHVSKCLKFVRISEKAPLI